MKLYSWLVPQLLFGLGQGRKAGNRMDETLNPTTLWTTVGSASVIIIFISFILLELKGIKQERNESQERERILAKDFSNYMLTLTTTLKEFTAILKMVNSDQKATQDILQQLILRTTRIGGDSSNDRL